MGLAPGRFGVGMEPGHQGGARQHVGAPNAVRQSARGRTVVPDTSAAWLRSTVSTMAACRARACHSPAARSATAIRYFEVGGPVLQRHHRSGLLELGQVCAEPARELEG